MPAPARSFRQGHGIEIRGVFPAREDRGWLAIEPRDRFRLFEPWSRSNRDGVRIKLPGPRLPQNSFRVLQCKPCAAPHVRLFSLSRRRSG
jgi:hypothetical protein